MQRYGNRNYSVRPNWHYNLLYDRLYNGPLVYNICQQAVFSLDVCFL